MEKSELEVVANFLKKMKEKYSVPADSLIAINLDGDMLVVSEAEYYLYEGYDLNELEKIKIE